MCPHSFAVSVVFQSTPSVGRATLYAVNVNGHTEFQSTPSVGRATRSAKHLLSHRRISIHALRGEGDMTTADLDSAIDISIHALRGEGDIDIMTMAIEKVNFNPRPPWGGRLKSRYPIAHKGQFQSTPSVGRATEISRVDSYHEVYFNPRPPWGGRPHL